MLEKAIDLVLEKSTILSMLDATRRYSYLKNKLSEALVEVICPVGKEIKKLLNDKSFLEKTLKEGTEKARFVAERNLKEIKNVVGFF